MSAKERSLTPRSAMAATRAFSWLLVVFSASVATGGEPESVRAQQSVGPGLILEDSVVLQESRDAYVGQPVEMFLGSDGSLFVIDGFSNSVARFDQSGRLIRTYGRQGRGPGEFSYIGFGGFAEEVLGVVDGRPPQQEIEFFDVESGRHLGRVATSNIVTAVTAHGEKLWVGGVNTDQWKGVGVKSLHALPGGEVALDRVPTPKPYSQSQLLLWIGGSARLHAGDADLLVGYMASPFLNARRPRRRRARHDTARGRQAPGRARRGQVARDGEQPSDRQDDLRRDIQRLVVSDESVQKRRFCLHCSPGQRASRPAGCRKALREQPARRRHEPVSRHARVHIGRGAARRGASRCEPLRPGPADTTTANPTVCEPSCGSSRWIPPSARAKSESEVGRGIQL